MTDLAMSENSWWVTNQPVYAQNGTNDAVFNVELNGQATGIPSF